MNRVIQLFLVSVLIQFETSGKWPDDIEAVQHIKAAFHLKIADCIRNETHSFAVATPTFVDVCKVYSELSYFFRCCCFV